MVVFATTYELILPAITMDRNRAAAMPGVEAGVAENTVWDSASSTESLAQDSAAAADGAWTEEGSWANDGTWTDDGTGTWTAQDTASASGTDTSTGGQTANGQAADGTVTENTATDAGTFDTDSSGADAFNTDSTTDSAAGTDTFGGSETSGEAWNPEKSDSQTDTAASDGSENSSAENLNAEDTNNGDSNNEALNPETLDSDQTASGENGDNPFADITDNGTDSNGNGTAVNEDMAAADADSVNGGNGASGNGDSSVIDGTVNENGTENANSDSNAMGTVVDTTTETEEKSLTNPVTLTFEGEDYTITATFDKTANLPAGVSLNAVEILPDMIYRDADGNVLYDDYDVYLEKTVDTLEKDGRLEDSYVASARFFDISFIDLEGGNVEPTAPVTVAVKYKEALSAEDTVGTVAVHFDDKKDKTEIIETEEDIKKDSIQEVSFDAEKFSVYAIVGTEITGQVYNGGTVTVSEGEQVEITFSGEDTTYDVKSSTSYSWVMTSGNSLASIAGATNGKFVTVDALAEGQAVLIMI